MASDIMGWLKPLPVLVAAVAIAFMTLFGGLDSSAFADKNTLSKDGCHNSKAVGYRHHHDENWGVLGECVERDGRTVKLVAPEVRIANLRAALSQAEAALAAEKKARIDAARRADRAIAQRDDARRQAEEQMARALARTAEAEAVAADAEARARGAGPRVDRRCRKAVELIVYGETGWLSDSVKVDSAGRASLSRACLIP